MERERMRTRTREGYTSVDFSILFSAFTYVKKTLGSIKAPFFKLFSTTRTLLNNKRMKRLPQINQIHKF